MYATTRTSSSLTNPLRPLPPHNNRISKNHSFEEFYTTRSKSFSIIDNIKNLKTPRSEFIDRDFVDAIDEKMHKKRMSDFIKRKVPTKMKTEQIEVLRGDSELDNKRRLKIFSTVFNKERRKVLSKFESSKEMKETVFKKLGMKKPANRPFFEMERGRIHSFEDRYIEEFRKINSKQRNKKHVKPVHPLCDIYQKQAKKVIKNHSFDKKVRVDYEPFGKIDYSAQYF